MRFTALSPLRFAATAFATAIAVLIVACALPHDRYLRFMDLTDPEVEAKWIYERIHFDPSPLDVVFIGTSHTLEGIDSDRVEQACRTANGKVCASVNFALVHLGRNVHWILTRDVLAARKPRLLVVEVQETEFRALHPAFPFLAEASDVALAPLIINTSYFQDLVRLPLRQITLFAKSSAPSLFGKRKTFAPELYLGPHGGEAPSAAQRQTVSPNELERQRAHLASADASRLRLPASLRRLEYRANLVYLTKLLEFAREKNVQVRFLYIPSYHAPQEPAFADFYKRYAPTWYPLKEIFDSSRNWVDAGHLNAAGSKALSDWVAAKIAGEVHDALSQSN
jgi:hypothetical protein